MMYLNKTRPLRKISNILLKFSACPVVSLFLNDVFKNNF